MTQQDNYYLSLEEIDNLTIEEKEKIPQGRMVLPNNLIKGGAKPSSFRVSRINNARTFDEARAVLVIYCLCTIEEGPCIRKMLDLASKPKEYRTLYESYGVHFTKEDYVNWDICCIESALAAKSPDGVKEVFLNSRAAT